MGELKLYGMRTASTNPARSSEIFWPPRSTRVSQRVAIGSRPSAKGAVSQISDHHSQAALCQGDQGGQRLIGRCAYDIQLSRWICGICATEPLVYRLAKSPVGTSFPVPRFMRDITVAGVVTCRLRSPFPRCCTPSLLMQPKCLRQHTLLRKHRLQAPYGNSSPNEEKGQRHGQVHPPQGSPKHYEKQGDTPATRP